MKITDLKIDGFGVWSGLRLNDLSDGLTVIYGRNEAGKTTLMQFLRGMFFGFTPERRQRYLPPVRGGTAGGQLQISSAQDTYLFNRTSPELDNPDDLENLLIESSDGIRHNSSLIQSLLNGIDESIYTNVFAVGLRDIQELSALNETDAANQLYALTDGIDRVSIMSILKKLETSRNQLVMPGSANASITELVAQRDNIQERIRQLSDESRQWARDAIQIDAIDDEISRIEEQRNDIQRRIRVLESAVTVCDRWRQLSEMDQQLNQSGYAMDISADAVEQLDGLNANIERYRERQTAIRDRCKELRDKAKGDSVNRPLWRNRARIEAIGEQRDWIASLESQMDRIAAKVAALETRLESIAQPMDENSGGQLEGVSDVSRESIRLLRAPARELSKARHRLLSAKKQVAVERQNLQGSAAEIETALSNRGERDLSSAIEKAGDQITQLRRRVQLDERVLQMKRHQSELKHQSHQLLDRQVLHWWSLMLLGALFCLGTTFLLTGLFGGSLLGLSTAAAWCLTVFGAVAALAAVSIKLFSERAAASQLDSGQKQIELLQVQVDRLGEEREELDRHLPSGGGPMVVRLKTAENELSELELLTPLDSQHQLARKQADDGQQGVTEATLAYREVRNQWSKALASLNFPDTLSPRNVRQLADQFEKSRSTRQQLEENRRELQQRENELNSVSERITTLLSDADLEPVSESPGAQLRQLTAALADQEDRARRFTLLKAQYRKLRTQYSDIGKRLRRAQQQRRSLLASAHATDEDDFRHLARKAFHLHNQRRNRDHLFEEITSAVGDTGSLKEIGQLLDGPDATPIDQQLKDLGNQEQTCEAKSKQLHEQRGRVHEQVRHLRGDWRLAEAQMELSCTNHQLEERVRQWQTLAATQLNLESVRQRYESERQPETLKEASKYLLKVTDGRYTRIWTPIDEDVLRVDESGSGALPIEVLSRGTREQIYLCLRLALVADYANRGICLPMVLDDVFVNFDSDRTKAAARQLREFAKAGNQVILFTCHEHIAKIFRSLRIKVRELPDCRQLVDGVEHETIDRPRRRKRRKTADVAPAVEDQLQIEQAPEDEAVEDESEEELAQDAAEDPPEQQELDVQSAALEESAQADSEQFIEPAAEPVTVLPGAWDEEQSWRREG